MSGETWCGSSSKPSPGWASPGEQPPSRAGNCSTTPTTRVGPEGGSRGVSCRARGTSTGTCGSRSACERCSGLTAAPQVAWHMTEDSSLPQHERAVYAALCGNLTQLQPVCQVCVWCAWSVGESLSSRAGRTWSGPERSVRWTSWWRQRSGRPWSGALPRCRLTTGTLPSPSPR